MESNKSLYTWGNGAYGQLGNNEETHAQPIPIKINFFEQISSIYAKYYNSFIFTNEGKIFAWGRTQQGSLGKSSGMNLKTPIEFIYLEQIRNMSNNKIASLSVNREHGGMIMENGKVFTWGVDYQGRLGSKGKFYNSKKDYKGNTQKTDISDLSPISHSLLSEVFLPSEYQSVIFKQISCGSTFTTLLSVEGQVYTFGSTKEGGLGNDKEFYEKLNKQSKLNNPDNFSQVKWFKDNNIEITKIASGNFFSCALSTSKRLFCWGKNDYGQLGTKINTFKSDIPVKVDFNDNIEDFEIGEDHAGLISSKKEVFLWGYGFDGRLCNGQNGNSNTPFKVNIPNPVSKIALGGQHTAILDSKNELYTCGNGNYGELGRGNQIESSVSNRNLPMPIDYFKLNKKRILDVKCGKSHTIALVEDLL